MEKNDFIRLSMIVSHALRHDPQSYNIILDSQGWVLLSDLVAAMNSNGMQISKDDIIEMVNSSQKKRHQIIDGKIRAYYGHSLKTKILKPEIEPPQYLYHGTIKANLDKIMENGLLPMERQFVHLSEDEITAELVGKRRVGILIILKVKAKKAFLDNIKFYKEENGIWLSDPIPPKYILCQ
jgi:putative RNA 2'-phosphotransferase